MKGCIIKMRRSVGGELVPNIVDYLAWRGDIKFSTSPFNDIDSLIITQLAMRLIIHGSFLVRIIVADTMACLTCLSLTLPMVVAQV